MWWRTRREKDLDAEIKFHLTQEAQLRADRGASLEEAEHGARRAFGSLALAREATRAVWVSTALEQLVQDLRFGCRILTKSPALSATAVILIALVIGGNTTVFSIAHGILRKPAEGVNAKGLVTLNWIDDRRQGGDPDISYRLYKDLAQHASTLRPMLAFQAFRRFTLNHENGSHAVHGMFVSGNYFEALEVRFARGRSFTEKEAEVPDPALMIVISDHAWETHFQRAADVIGKGVMLSGHPVTIIGVAAARFRGTLLGQSADVWLPLASYARATGQQRSLLDGDESWVAISGRLAPGTSIARASAEMTAIWSRLQATEPELEHLQITLVPYSLTAGSGTLIAHRGERMLAIFSIVTAMTLLIVCANVANLLIARGVIRQREMALRQSLGASRVRVVRALLAEGLVLSLAAWLAACLFASWNSRAVRRYFITTMEGTIVWPDFTPSWTVIGYALVLAVLCTVACTIAPAIRAWRQQLLPSLKAGEQAVIQGRSRLSSALVVVQLALSVLLVTSAGLAYRSLFLIDNFDSGFDTRRLLLVTVNTAGSAGNPDANESLLELLREELRGVAGVERVTYARNALQQRWHADVSGLGSSTEPFDAERNHIGPDYFQVLGVPLMAGRALAPEDNSRTVRSAVISQSLARTLWPGQSPLGRTVLVEKQEAEVVGVVPDRSFSGFRRQPRGFVFLSAQQDPAAPGEATFYVKYSGGLDTIGPAIGRRLRQVDARAPIVSMNTWDSQLAGFLWPVRVLTILLMLFAGGSLFIAAVGQYGVVVSFDMRRRVRELGLRMALGASAGQVMRSVLREGFRLTIIGLAIGFALSLATGRVLGLVLYGITPTDPLTYAGVFALLSVASVLACYLPSRRASRINPMMALRNE